MSSSRKDTTAVRCLHHQPATSVAGTSATEQNRFNEHFRENAQYWKRIYQEETDVFALIHQQRMGRIKELVDRLRLPARTRVLEVGCGTGLTAIAMAEHGFEVEAMDSVPAMIDLTRQHAEAAGVSARVTTMVGDCHRLIYPDDSFPVVIAMGVTPFLHSLPVAMSEFARVLKPGGHLIVNADNRWRLNRLMDPLLTAFLGPLRRSVKTLLRFLPGRASAGSNYSPHMYSPREFDAILARTGLQVVSSSMLGFGPFSFFGLGLPDCLGLPLHRALQALADLRFPVLRFTGSQYMVLATKADVARSTA